MSVKNAGKKCRIEKDVEILKVNSPQSTSSEVGIYGEPHVVVAKSVKHRWAIVALTRRAGDYTNNERRLGIRWFHKERGHPNSSGYSVWFILPQEFHSCILQELKGKKLISEGQRKLLLKFLEGKVVNPLTDGEALKKDWKAA